MIKRLVFISIVFFPMGLLAETTPCPFASGVPLPSQGSGICRGSIVHVLSLPDLGMSLVRSSAPPVFPFSGNAGFGNHGWTWGGDSYLTINATATELTFITADGSSILYNNIRGVWERVGDFSVKIQTLGAGYQLSFVGGEILDYQPMPNSGASAGFYGLASIIDGRTNQVQMTITRDPTYGYIQALQYPIVGQTIAIVSSSTANGSQWTISNSGVEYTLLDTPTLTTLTDPKGKTTSVGYDGFGNVSMITSSNQEITSFKYQQSSGSPPVSLISMITDSLTNVRSFSYTAASASEFFNGYQVLTETFSQPAGATLNVLATAVTDNNTYTDSYVFTSTSDPLTWLPASVTNELGESFTVTYDTNFLPYQISSAGVTTTVSSREKNWLLPTAISSNTLTESITYDRYGQPLTVSGPGTRAITFNYGTGAFKGLPTGYVDGGVQVLTATLDPNTKNPLSLSSFLGYTWKLGYDSYTNITSVTDPLGYVTQIGYQTPALGLVGSVANPNGTGLSLSQNTYGGAPYSDSYNGTNGASVLQASETHSLSGGTSTITDSLTDSQGTQTWTSTENLISGAGTLYWNNNVLLITYPDLRPQQPSSGAVVYRRLPPQPMAAEPTNP